MEEVELTSEKQDEMFAAMTANADTGDSSGTQQVAGNLASALNAQASSTSVRRRRLSAVQQAAEAQARTSTRENIMGFLSSTAGLQSKDQQAVKQQAGVVNQVVGVASEVTGSSLDGGAALTDGLID